MAVLMGQTYVSTNFCGFSHNSIVFKPCPSWFGVPHQPRVDYAIETNDMVLPSLPILGNSHRCHGQDMVFFRSSGHHTIIGNPSVGHYASLLRVVRQSPNMGIQSPNLNTGTYICTVYIELIRLIPSLAAPARSTRNAEC